MSSDRTVPIAFVNIELGEFLVTIPCENTAFSVTHMCEMRFSGVQRLVRGSIRSPNLRTVSQLPRLFHPDAPCFWDQVGVEAGKVLRASWSGCGSCSQEPEAVLELCVGGSQAHPCKCWAVAATASL